jgi:hypothetical protein
VTSIEVRNSEDDSGQLEAFAPPRDGTGLERAEPDDVPNVPPGTSIAEPLAPFIEGVKRVFFWCLLALLVYAVFEGAAWFTYRILFVEPFSFTQLGELRTKSTALIDNEKNPDAAKPSLLIHPYYGYIMNPIHNADWLAAIDDPVNAYGFFGDVSPIQPRDPKKLIVAITGGSVATYAAAWGRQAFIEGLSKIRRFAGRKIVLLNLGSAAYKQPQQLMVISDLLSQGGHIDLLIDFDGFNEIALPQAHDAFGQGASPFFPQRWHLITETGFSRGALLNVARITLLKERRARWAQGAGRRPWRWSISASLLWRIADNHLAAQHAELERALSESATSKVAGLVPTTADMRTTLGPPNDLSNARQLYEASARLWLNASVFLNNLAASQGGLYVHVLQPNQYFQGSKPMGLAETKRALSDQSVYKAEVERGYPYLRSAGKTLQQLGVHFYDLALLFKNEPAPVYGDACCHFTREGNEKLVNAIVARVAEAVADDASPRFVSISADPDFGLEALRSLSLRPKDYRDGSDIALR